MPTKVIQKPRIYDNLLSSQPLCFNIFGELSRDLPLATRVMRALWPERVHEVKEIAFEYSPGRGDTKYLSNRSAFDVFVRYASASGREGFIGIEVKYHENLGGDAADHKSRYDEVADRAAIYSKASRPHLRRLPLQQIWLDHLLALSMLQADEKRWSGGMLAFIYPAANLHCAAAAAAYRRALTSASSFDSRTLEELVAVIQWYSHASWPAELSDRYLRIEKLASLGIGPLRQQIRSQATNGLDGP